MNSEMKNAEIKIGTHAIGPDSPVFMIAEMSGNHNRDLARAHAIIDAAADAGADALKLQTYTADTITLTGKTGVIMAAQNITGTAQAGLVLVGTATAVLQSSALAAVKAPAVMLGG